MTSANTHADCPPTFTSNTGSESFIDHVFVPTALLGVIERVQVLSSSAERLQIAVHREHRDHKPVVVAFHARLSSTAAPRRQLRPIVKPYISACRRGTSVL
eukprot:2081187-Pyramimonas_sp.AAC.1